MSNSANWRTETDASDYFLHQKKQVELGDRRPVIRRPSDLVGPGIAANAVRITDFSNVLATFNGFFGAAEGANDAPTAGQPYVGWVTSDAELGGVQYFTGLDDNVSYRRSFRRNPASASTIYWSAWAEVADA